MAGEGLLSQRKEAASPHACHKQLMARGLGNSRGASGFALAGEEELSVSGAGLHAAALFPSLRKEAATPQNSHNNSKEHESGACCGAAGPTLAGEEEVCVVSGAGSWHLGQTHSEKPSHRSEPRHSKHRRNNAPNPTSATVNMGATRLQQIMTEARRTRTADHDGLFAGTLRRTLRSQLSSCIDRLTVEVFMSLIIFLNATQVGISSEVRRDWLGWKAIDGIFGAIFLSEILLKCRWRGVRKFFWGGDWVMNWLDFGLVVSAIIEMSIIAIDAATDGDVDDGPSHSRFSAMRIFRMLRLAPVFRIARLPMFGELMMMLEGAKGGIRALMWSQVLVAIFLYVVALIFRELIGASSFVDGDDSPSRYFRSLPDSFFTSFRCLIANDCSDSSGRPIFVAVAQSHGWHVAAIYCIAMVLISFGLFNVIVAIYVENTVAAAKYNEYRRKQQRLMDKKRFQHRAHYLVDYIVKSFRPKDHHGGQPALMRMSLEELSSIAITPEMFEQLAASPEFRDALRDLDIADEVQVDLFDTLDVDGSGTIDLEELLSGVAKLRGDARRSDIVSVGLMVRDLQNSVRNLQHSMFQTMLRSSS